MYMKSVGSRALCKMGAAMHGMHVFFGVGKGEINYI